MTVRYIVTRHFSELFWFWYIFPYTGFCFFLFFSNANRMYRKRRVEIDKKRKKYTSMWYIFFSHSFLSLFLSFPSCTPSTGLVRYFWSWSLGLIWGVARRAENTHQHSWGRLFFCLKKIFLLWYTVFNFTSSRFLFRWRSRLPAWILHVKIEEVSDSWRPDERSR